MKQFDVIVVGGGHAGVEAAQVAARMGMKTALITGFIDTIAIPPCNPAIGGPGKTQLVMEIDALGGIMGRVTNESYIQARVLNKGKGPAVWSQRAQIDKDIYPANMRKRLMNTPNLDLVQGLVVDLLTEGNRVLGGKLEYGEEILGKAVVLTTGTFMKGKIYISSWSKEAGRWGEFPSYGISDALKRLGLKILRFNTGTTPRLDGRTIDWDRLEIQPGEEGITFSFFEEPSPPGYKPVYITRTTKHTMDIVRMHIHLTASRASEMVKVGPRYCPSIEEKAVWFPDRNNHIIFLEPVGLNTEEIYPNGLAISLPVEIQEMVVRSIPGLEEAVIVRPGYTIDYDLIAPHQLHPSMKVKGVEGLFSAGQINGTTGYEEAAAQGIIAGINAALYVKGEKPFILSREDAYIGVLIDELTTHPIREPYRMLTSRSEYRLVLRQDNAAFRLSEKAYNLGILTKEEIELVRERQSLIEGIKEKLKKTFITKADMPFLKGKTSAHQVLKRPEIHATDLIPFIPEIEKLDSQGKLTLEIDVKYEGYIKRDMGLINEAKKLSNMEIPEDIDYDNVPNLSREGRDYLKEFKPATLGQASQIPGVSSGDIVALMIYLKRLKGIE